MLVLKIATVTSDSYIDDKDLTERVAQEIADQFRKRFGATAVPENKEVLDQINKAPKPFFGSRDLSKIYSAAGITLFYVPTSSSCSRAGEIPPAGVRRVREGDLQANTRSASTPPYRHLLAFTPTYRTTLPHCGSGCT